MSAVVQSKEPRPRCVAVPRPGRRGTVLVGPAPMPAARVREVVARAHQKAPANWVADRGAFIRAHGPPLGSSVTGRETRGKGIFPTPTYIQKPLLSSCAGTGENAGMKYSILHLLAVVTGLLGGVLAFWRYRPNEKAQA